MEFLATEPAAATDKKKWNGLRVQRFNAWDRQYIPSGSAADH
jgi:hypothetical protein